MKLSSILLPKTIRDRTAGLTPGKKVSYLMTYYWIPIVAAACLLLLIVVAILNATAFHKYVALTVVMVNSEKIEDAPFDAYLDGVEDYSSATDTINVETGIKIDLYELDGTEAMMTYQLLAARFLKGDMDIFIAESDIVETFANKGGAVDLRMIFTTEQLEKYADRFIVIENEETGELTPCGVTMDESSDLLKVGYYDKPVVACLVALSSSPEMGRYILLRMLGE